MHFQIREVSEVTLDDAMIENGAHDVGCLIPGDRAWHVRNPNGYVVLLLRVASATLQRKLSTLLGSDRARLDLRQPSSAAVHRTLLRDAAIGFASELDEVDPKFLPSLVANSTEDICIGMLTCLSEPYLEAERSPAAPSHHPTGASGAVHRRELRQAASPWRRWRRYLASAVAACSTISVHDTTALPINTSDKSVLDMAYVKLLACHNQDSLKWR